MPMPTPNDVSITNGQPHRWRTLWLSDFHLGTRGCQAESLLTFLRQQEAETLFLIGDIVDLWFLKRSWYWPTAHNDVVQEILKKARQGTRVIYIPGNHDEILREVLPLHLGGVEMVADFIHQTADGRRLWIIHGDEFDGLLRYVTWLSKLGSHFYHGALRVNHAINSFRIKRGRSSWSLAGALKHRVKNALAYVTSYEKAVTEEARLRGVDGVVCGHIHWAEMRQMGSLIYCNTGDWVDHATALAESATGELILLKWDGKKRQTV